MNAVDRHTVARKLEYLRTQLDRLAGYKRLPEDVIAHNFEKRYTAERLLELCIQSVIDSSRLLVALEGWKVRQEDRDPLLLLADPRVISETLAERLMQAKAFRNILVHEYADIRPELLSSHLRTGFSDLEEFHALVSRHVGQSIK